MKTKGPSSALNSAEVLYKVRCEEFTLSWGPKGFLAVRHLHHRPGRRCRFTPPTISTRWGEAFQGDLPSSLYAVAVPCNACAGSYFKAHGAVPSATLSLNTEQSPRLFIQDGLSFVDYRYSPNAGDGKFLVILCHHLSNVCNEYNNIIIVCGHM